MLRTDSEQQAIEPRRDFLCFLAEIDCAVTVRLRPVVNRIVSAEYVAVLNAPPKVISAVMRAYPYSSLTENGLLVNVTMRGVDFAEVFDAAKNDNL
jgi:hypothetical protein